MEDTVAKAVEGVSEKILACAQEEFSEKGFSDASMRTIAAKAGTTTGSIYSRFGGKEGLFEAIVAPVAEDFIRMFREIQQEFHEKEASVQEQTLDTYTSAAMLQMLDYMYEHYAQFRLLLDASYGTRFQDFVEQLVEIETEYTCMYMEVLQTPAEDENLITPDFLHIMNKALFESFFEVIRHQMPKDKAVRYIRMLGRYHGGGWQAIRQENV